MLLLLLLLLSCQLFLPEFDPELLLQPLIQREPLGAESRGRQPAGVKMMRVSGRRGEAGKVVGRGRNPDTRGRRVEAPAGGQQVGVADGAVWEMVPAIHLKEMSYSMPEDQ